MLYLSTTQGVFRVHPLTGAVAPLGPTDTSVESIAVDGDVLVAAVTPDYGLPMRNPLHPGARRGAMRSADGGQTWRPLGDCLVGQQVTALATLTTGRAGGTAPTTFVAGTDPAELLISRDGGETWARGQSLKEMPGYGEWSYPLPPHTPHVMVIVGHPTEADTIYAGIEVGGIVRSRDGGATWQVIGGGRNEDVHPDIHGLAVSPAEPSVVYAATPQGVFVSTDGGERWQRRINGIDPLYCRPIVVLPESPDVAIVVATNGASGFFGIPAERTGGRVFRTTDRGQTWQRVTAGLPESLAPTPTLAVEAGVGDSGAGRVYLPLFSGEVYVSENGGAEWRELARGLPPILRAVVA